MAPPQAWPRKSATSQAAKVAAAAQRRAEALTRQAYSTRLAKMLCCRRALALVLFVPALACRAPAERAEATLSTVEVTAKPDVGASLAADEVGAPLAQPTGIAGVLPDGFPRDVPLPEPSSLVDFTTRAVTLEVQLPESTARARYLARLAAAGFAAESDRLFRHGARRIAVDFAARSGATRITIEILTP